MNPSPARADFDRDGFVIVRGLLDLPAVRLVRDEFEALAHAARTMRGTRDLDGSRFVIGRRTDGRSCIRRVVWCGGARPELLAIGRSAAIVDLAGELLRRDDLVHLINQAHFKEPGDGVDFPWHQDSHHRRCGTELWTDLDGRGSFVEIVVAVDPMTETNGGLYVLPGSHRRGHLPHDLSTGALSANIIDTTCAVPVELQPGDAVAFGPYLVHGSRANRSHAPRRALLNGFAVPGANRRVYPGVGLGELVRVA
jgi:ectoine hydroxylase-related dioxygenase (phytanoyl-CoA dioxygenase family)